LEYGVVTLVPTMPCAGDPASDKVVKGAMDE